MLSPVLPYRAVYHNFAHKLIENGGIKFRNIQVLVHQFQKLVYIRNLSGLCFNFPFQYGGKLLYGSGAGVSVTPVAFLVVSNGNVRTVQLVEKVSAVDNVIASLPELVDKVAALIKKEKPGADAPAE